MGNSYIWKGGQGNFNDPNWNGGTGSGHPTSADDATINTGDTVTVDALNGNALDLTIDSGAVYVGGASDTNGTGATLTVGNLLTVGASAYSPPQGSKQSINFHVR
jgi:hypothetical protein